MNIDPSGHWPQLFDRIAEGFNKLVDTGKKVMEDVVDTVKSGVNYVVDKVVDFFTPEAEDQSGGYYIPEEIYITSRQDILRDTDRRIQEASIPKITTINYPNEIVRNNISTIQKSCEGTEAIKDQSYDYKDMISQGTGKTEIVDNRGNDNSNKILTKDEADKYIHGGVLGGYFSSDIEKLPKVVTYKAGGLTFTYELQESKTYFMGVEIPDHVITNDDGTVFDTRTYSYNNIKVVDESGNTVEMNYGIISISPNIKGATKTGNRPTNLSPEGAGRNGAFREAKRNSGIPVSEQPKSVTPAVDKRGNRIPGKDYDFGDGKVIRDHSGGHEFPDDPSQNRGPHFNDPDGNHYDY